MATLLEAKMLFLIHLGWEANETQFSPPELIRAA